MIPNEITIDISNNKKAQETLERIKLDKEIKMNAHFQLMTREEFNKRIEKQNRETEEEFLKLDYRN